jgi:DNA-binding SARP family transcriptional activator
MEGNAAEALRQYRSYARLLADELGARPSPSMDRLLEGVTANLSRGLGDGHVTAEA